MKHDASVYQRLGGAVLVLALISGCASQQPSGVGQSSGDRSAGAMETKQSNDRDTAGGRYAMSGDAYPLDPPDVSDVPDAQPRDEPYSRAGNRPTYEVWGKTYHVLPDADGYSKRGLASWYGKKFHGYATSNGEIYDMYKMSAAHRSLPLPTYARVTNQRNGQSVIVRVNDRGPFHSDREIDLSYAAAARLDILDEGTGEVKVEAINPAQWRAQRSGGRSSAPEPETSPTQASPARSSEAESGAENDASTVYLQIAALGDARTAEQLQARLSDELAHQVRVQARDDVYRVQVGPVAADQEAEARKALHDAGFTDVFIVR
ncbi:septal ring lytic transglycosylase RlpA family protein [Halomonas sp. CUBES01]|uniref:septal ring lytic transglycosylase RlpA family protein n=1 Tax=Halomonas sp. CUBES01 TaxID=2897340 RepID=UPI001E368198|nr:septal ring lytic transglycosylase RlpA family protein [Halomonas sp. CUBES01]MEC4767554.1 septal ring lytic transglycosylase RlpA family protein [Halomonas sp. CUBES01]